MAGIIIPHIISSTDGHEHNTDLVSYDLMKNRIVYLNGEINAQTALSTITQLRYLDNKAEKDIYLVINSPGGSVSDGLAVYDSMQGIGSDVVTVGTGIAASMGSFLLAAGTPGKRYATLNTEIMIHQPLGGVQGQATDISLVADHIQKVKDKLAGILAEKCGKEKRIILSDMERDHWMSSGESKAYGLIDFVGFPEII